MFESIISHAKEVKELLKVPIDAEDGYLCLKLNLMLATVRSKVPPKKGSHTSA